MTLKKRQLTYSDMFADGVGKSFLAPSSLSDPEAVPDSQMSHRVSQTLLFLHLRYPLQCLRIMPQQLHTEHLRSQQPEFIRICFCLHLHRLLQRALDERRHHLGMQHPPPIPRIKYGTLRE